jgi:hypothetical protein
VRALALAGSGRVPSTASTTTTPALTHMPKRSGMGALITWSEPLRRSRHPVGNPTFKTTVHPRTEPDRPGCWGRRSAPLTTHHARPESILATGGRLDAGAPRRRKRRAMEPVDHPSALCGQLVSPIGEQPEHCAEVLAEDPPQVGVLLCYQGPRCARRCHRSCSRGPDPADGTVRRAWRAYQERPRPGGEQLLGEQVAEAARPLDRPSALGPGAGPALVRRPSARQRQEVHVPD